MSAIFSPRRIAKFLGLHGGKRRRRQDPIAWSLLAVVGAVAFAKAAILTVLQVAAVKGVSR
jgi:hypothetical protein